MMHRRAKPRIHDYSFELNLVPSVMKPRLPSQQQT
jgi:hypothetical protein